MYRIDPGYPNERIEYILEDTKTDLLLTQGHLEEKLEEITKSNKSNKDKKTKQQKDIGNRWCKNKRYTIKRIGKKLIKNESK